MMLPASEGGSLDPEDLLHNASEEKPVDAYFLKAIREHQI